MSDKNITHKNHYVPQFYLKNWSKDGHTIFVYSLLVSNPKVPYWKQESIKRVAIWSDLYTRRVEQQDIDDFEDWFDREFESPAKPIFGKLLNNERITKEEHIIISRFVAAQYVRTPGGLEKILSISKAKVPEVFQKVLNNVNRDMKAGKLPRTIKPLTEDDKLLPLKVSFDKEQGVAEVNSIVGKGMYLYAVKHLLTKTVQHMYNYHWYVIQAAEEVSFPTSDDPVILLNYQNEHNYDFKGGWGRKHTNIIMPLSPSKLLFTEIGSGRPCDALSHSPHWSQFFRKIIIEHAHRAVFADAPQKGMMLINPRIANKELYEKEKQIIATWHEEQSLAEEHFSE